MPLKTFHKGGIHPPHRKLTAGRSISSLDIPKKVVIPLQQHIGKPAKCLVKKGDEVAEGQLIGEADGFISAHVHASVPGKVKDIIHGPTPLFPRVPCVVIETSGEFQYSQSEKSGSSETESCSVEQIREAVYSAGIVGMGGATFPSIVKLSPPKDKQITDLIINGVECEPYLTSDHRLMMEKPDEIITGVRLLAKLFPDARVTIGIEANKKDAIFLFQRKTAGTEISVQGLKVKYPQGAEKQLINAVTKKYVPQGSLPMDVGCLVHNVATVFAVREAVMENRPLIERVVTLSGDALHNPGNYRIRIGAQISDIIEQIGGFKKEPSKVLAGGPMMGIALNNLSIPVMKGTSGLLFFTERMARKVDYRKFDACISCGRCVRVCPQMLNPSLFSVLGENHDWEGMEDNEVLDCVECGSCNYICPANRPIVQLIKTSKSELRRIK